MKETIRFPIQKPCKGTGFYEKNQIFTLKYHKKHENQTKTLVFWVV